MLIFSQIFLFFLKTSQNMYSLHASVDIFQTHWNIVHSDFWWTLRNCFFVSYIGPSQWFCGPACHWFEIITQHIVEYWLCKLNHIQRSIAGIRLSQPHITVLITAIAITVLNHYGISMVFYWCTTISQEKLSVLWSSDDKVLPWYKQWFKSMHLPIVNT